MSPRGASGHIHIQDPPFVKEPLSIHIEEAGSTHKGTNGTSQLLIGSANLDVASPYSLTSQTSQAPVSASTMPGTPGADSRTKPRRRDTLRRSLSKLGHNHLYSEAEESVIRFWDRFTRKGKENIGVVESLRVIVTSSWLMAFLIFVPLAWVSHFLHWPKRVTFTLSFLAIIPLEWLVEWGGDEMAHYLGKDLGDLLSVTLHNAVEATLAIILLTHCEIALLKSTIIGVVILHLLLVPGAAFITGGARVLHQDLHPHLTELNHSLLTLGVLALLLPAAFFSALTNSFNPNGTAEANALSVNDELRDSILKMSRGMSFCLLFIYICSRIYLHNPPGEEKLKQGLHLHPEAPEALKAEERHLQQNDPHVNQYVCIVMLILAIAVMASTAEWLVKALNFARKDSVIQIEWFGLILLPLVSYAADGTVAIVYWIRHLLRHYFKEPVPVATLAKGRAIDLSIQFTLFWMPFFVLLGWWTGRPMSLLFDSFEVAVLVGACFIVNYVTADSRTNWAEGATMVSFYVMIAVCAWFYPGQPESFVMSECGSVAGALASLASGHTLGDSHH